jgi:hypothetical protein
MALRGLRAAERATAGMKASLPARVSAVEAQREGVHRHLYRLLLFFFFGRSPFKLESDAIITSCESDLVLLNSVYTGLKPLYLTRGAAPIFWCSGYFPTS